jgi:cytochrome c-type biogenesis protein CcmH
MRLTAQSYDYMGRTIDARAARMQASTEQDDGTTTRASRITGTVHILAELAATACPGTTLFVYATEPGTPGPPLAFVKLRVDAWPMSFVLDDADAMIPGRTLSSVRRLQLEARVSPSGAALPCAGDLLGRLENVDPRTAQPIRISIDHRIE